jgi:hypothetical protein
MPLVEKQSGGSTVDDNNRRWLSSKARVQVVHIRTAVEVLLSLHRTMPFQLAFTYLHIVEEEGLTVTALAHRIGVHSTVISRHLRDLGNINRRGERGLELIVLAQRVHWDRREHRAYLSEHGVNTARKIAEALRGDLPALSMSVAEPRS